jgi:hypothetical protein
MVLQPFIAGAVVAIFRDMVPPLQRKFNLYFRESFSRNVGEISWKCEVSVMNSWNSRSVVGTVPRSA